MPCGLPFLAGRPKLGLTGVPIWDVIAGMLDPRETLSRFDSLKQVADLLGVKYSTVLNWPGRGIPHRHRWPLLRKAAELGVPLSEEDVFGSELSTTSRKRGRA